MKLEHWMQLLFGTVILSGVGFLAVHLFDMKGTLSSVNEKVIHTDDRVGRIAKVLPDIGINIAWERVNEDLSGFVIASSDSANVDRSASLMIKVYEKEASKLHTYKVPASCGDRNLLAFALTGKIRQLDGNALSFDEMHDMSMKLKEPISLNSTIDKHASYIFRLKKLKEIKQLIESWSGPAVESKKFAYIHNWKVLASHQEDIKFD